MVIVKAFYFKDIQWYIAFGVAIVFWVLMDIFIQPALFQNPINTPEIFFFSILLYPIFEELVFRGLIQGQLMRRVTWRRRWAGISGANVVTSIFFSLLHLAYQEPLSAALIFFPSLIFGYFRDRYRRVFPSILLHIFYNAGFFTLFFTE